MVTVNTQLDFERSTKEASNLYPCLWFDGNAREAAEYYCSVFKDSVIKSDNQIVVIFEASAQTFMLLNGGPEFRINPSISFYVIYESTEELDTAWEKLISGGSVLMPLNEYPWSPKYGWLQDQFGVNWQLSMGNLKEMGQKFTPSMMFTGKNNGRAENAINFYTSIFRNSYVRLIARYEKGDNDTEGNIKHSQFILDDHVFAAMESSLMHNFTFNEGFSFVVECDSQEEIDYFWNKLSEGGEEGQCGWLKDKYGISWQIIPSILEQLMLDPGKAKNVMDAFLKMKKFEIDKLLEAYRSLR